MKMCIRDRDSYSFMEKMVSETEMQKVLIISDKKYADKANGRDGGVGTETQIISAEVYKNRQQEKFVAAVVERDEDVYKRQSAEKCTTRLPMSGSSSRSGSASPRCASSRKNTARRKRSRCV